MGGVEDPVALGFLLVTGAGMATGLGAAAVFNKRLIQLASKRVLAGALAISAGVMLYVSFVEIFVKSHGAFLEAGHAEDKAYLYATLCLFGGCFMMKLIDLFVHFLDHNAGHAYESFSSVTRRLSNRNINEAGKEAQTEKGAEAPSEAVELPAAGQDKGESAGDAVILPEEQTEEPTSPLKMTLSDVIIDDLTKADSTDGHGNCGHGHGHNTTEDASLQRMGLLTALAIGIHNFPEGLATFVGTLADPAVGVSLAIAIAIHNVPEGLCVAVPIYYATGSRWKAFGWAMLSGVSEPIGALVGWFILNGVLDQNVYGTLFGFVGGMMIMICIHELIPTALRYDPEDKVCTTCLVLGMAIMAASLVLFVF